MDEKLFTCLNGSFVLAHRAAISVADRGFRYGDGLFETMRVERGVPLYWDAHMARLTGGLTTLSINLTVAELEPYAKKLLLKNNAREGFLRLTISRSAAGSRGYAPHPPNMPAGWVMEWFAGEITTPPPCMLYLASVARIPPVCLPTQFKLAQGMNSTLALIEAHKAGADEALQLAIDGAIAEAASANIFWLKKDVLYTPTLETGCLAGITRDTVLRLSPVPTKIVREGLSTLDDADAVFLTNSRVGIWPVKALMPSCLSFNANHAIHRQLAGLLAQDRQRQLFAERSRWGTK